MSETDRRPYVGQALKRIEDPKLVGQGQYVDDLKLPGLAFLAFLRSPHAHGPWTAAPDAVHGGRARAQAVAVSEVADVRSISASRAIHTDRRSSDQFRASIAT